MGTIVAAYFIGTLTGQWLGVLIASLAVLLIFWLLSPLKLDKAPRQLSPSEIVRLSTFIKNELSYISEKEIHFLGSHDQDFESKVQTAFSSADWDINRGLILSDAYYTKGIWIWGKYRRDIAAAFESIKIPVQVSNDRPDDNETYLFFGS